MVITALYNVVAGKFVKPKIQIELSVRVLDITDQLKSGCGNGTSGPCEQIGVFSGRSEQVS